MFLEDAKKTSASGFDWDKDEALYNKYLMPYGINEEVI